MNRYEILRTGFVWGGSLPEPLQVVQKRMDLPVQEYDFRGLEGAEARLGSSAPPSTRGASI